VAKPKYRPGQIIWASVPDRHGVIKPNPRPILLTLVHPTVRSAPVMGLAISTRGDIDPQNDPVVEMPWDAKTGASTGLFEWCAVVLLWPVSVEQRDIVKVSGSVPSDFLEKVSDRLKQARFWQAQRNQK
jgi:hypothetical protein